MKTTSFKNYAELEMSRSVDVAWRGVVSFGLGDFRVVVARLYVHVIYCLIDVCREP